MRVYYFFKNLLFGLFFSLLNKLLGSKPFLDSLVRVLENKNEAASNLLEAVLEHGTLRFDPARGEYEQSLRSQFETSFMERTGLAHMEFDSIRLAHILSEKMPHPEPECSIVIPVFNKAHLTYTCIRSILLSEVASTYEIIVFDNASTDDTPLLLDYFRDHVVAIKNDENLGFVDACNRGAAAARGKYVVFLNNDTEVPDGWLDRLAGTIGSRPDAGAVGAKLVYPDGRLQEAGGIIYNNGSGANYGKGEDPAELKYNYLREVDYCSGACLLVRKDLFDRLGGFDTRYAPAYYEDADLCFGIRRLGYKVLYQPLCEITHFEGATAGTDVTSGLKRYQVVNRDKFVEKWREELSAQHDPSEGFDAAADRNRGPGILVMDWQVPTFDRDAGSARIYLIMKMLVGMGYRVSFMMYPDAAVDRYARALYGEGVRLVRETDIRDELREGVYGLVIISRLVTLSKHLSDVQSAAGKHKVPIIYDTVDLCYIREQRMADQTGDKKLEDLAASHKEHELKLAGRCDMVLTVTEADRQHLLSELPELNIEVIPTIHEPLGGEPDPAGRDTILYLAGFKHPPNVDALLYYMSDIHPIVARELPGVRLYVVGDSPPEEVEAFASDTVTVTGYVEDLDPYFGKSRVFIAPIRFGSGIKGKIGTSLSYGVPVVTTTVGAEGMDLVHGETAMIHDDPEGFAADVVGLFREDALWLRLARQGMAHSDRLFGPATVEERLRSIIGRTLKARQEEG